MLKGAPKFILGPFGPVRGAPPTAGPNQGGALLAQGDFLGQFGGRNWIQGGKVPLSTNFYPFWTKLAFFAFFIFLFIDRINDKFHFIALYLPHHESELHFDGRIAFSSQNYPRVPIFVPFHPKIGEEKHSEEMHPFFGGSR